MTCLLLIALAVLTAYYPALKSGYAIDDLDVFNRPHIPKNKRQKLWWQIIGYKYFDPQPEHLINIVIHLINCEFIYFAFGHSNTSFLAALLFAVNPAGTQGSVWLSGRQYIINTGIILLMWWISPLFYFITPFFAFNAILAPLLFIRAQWWWMLLIPLALLIARPNRQAIESRLNMATGKGQKISLSKIIIALKTLGYYTCLALFPVRLGIYHEFLYTYSLSVKDNDFWERIDKFFWIGCLVVCILVINFIWNYNPAAFGLFWFCLFIAQWLNIISLNQSIGERYLYLPLVGMMYCLANTIMAIPDFTIKAAVFTAILVYYLTRLEFHIPAYKNIDNCVTYNILNFPNLYVCWTWRGQIEKNKGNLFTAFEAWATGWKLRPVDFRLNNNLAVLLTDMGYLNDAESFLKNAEENVIPEQKKAAGEFIAHERERIEKARIILHNRAIAERIKMPKTNV